MGRKANAVVGASRWTPRAARAMPRQWTSCKQSLRTFLLDRNASLKDIYTQRRWLDFYGGVMAHRNGNSADSDLVDLSRDYTSGEIAHIWDGNDFSERYLLAGVLSLDLTEIRQLDCPLIIFAGRYDVNVNSDLAAAWYAKVKAPSKQFIWFENSAHLPMTEEPGKFLISLVRNARSLAEKARDVPSKR